MIRAVDGPCGRDASDRGGVRAHPRERTRTGGTGPARHPAPEAVLVSVDRHGAALPQWIRRNQLRAKRAGVLILSAGTYEVAARFLPLTVRTRPEGSISRGGSARQ